MKSKILLIAGVSILALSTITVAILYYLQLTNKLPETLSIFPTSTPTTVTPTAEPFSLGKYLILPEKFSFTADEVKFIGEQGYKTMLIDSTNTELIAKAKALFPSLSVYSIGTENSDITKCTEADLAVPNITATASENSRYYLSKGTCSKSTKLAEVIETQCTVNDTSCFEYIQKNLHHEAYLYLPKHPFITSFAAPQVVVDTSAGFPVILWQTYFPNTKIAQQAYSVEIQDLQKKRIYASGKVQQKNMGDYYIPTTAMESQTMSVILRVWTSIDGKTVTNPEIFTTVFAYTKPDWQLTTPASTTIQQSSWIPDWGMPEGLASVKKNPKKWDTILPVWFIPKNDGTLTIRSTSNDKALITLLKNNGVKLMPTLSLFDADILRSILRNNMDKHIEEIVRQVSTNNYDGIDLDYESTYADDREYLLTFLRKLKGELAQRGKILSFTAMHKVDSRKIYAYLPQTHEAQDWKAIGEIVDEFRIMAYDFTGQGSNQPGPLSPIVWDEILLRYALQNVPKEKIILALPLYSHAWKKPKSTDLAGQNNDQNLYTPPVTSTLSWQHLDIAYVKKNSSYYRESYDDWNKEVRVELKYKGVERVMYYLDKKSIDLRIDLAKKYGIKGVCYWRIGDEVL